MNSGSFTVTREAPMSDGQRIHSGKGLPSSPHHGRLVGSSDVGQIIELKAEIQRLWRQLSEKRCPRNPGMRTEHCDQCQRKEPGHGSELVKQQLADTRQRLRAVSESLKQQKSEHGA